MIFLAEGAVADLERIVTFNLEFGPEWALGQLASIRRAVMILEEHPRIGRPIPGRELVTSVGPTGCVALYQHDVLDAVVRIVAVRHQREAGYRER